MIAFTHDYVSLFTSLVENILRYNEIRFIHYFYFKGRFDLEKHKKWIDENPNKRPKPLETRKHVSHFYSGGDICDITGNYLHIGTVHGQPSI